MIENKHARRVEKKLPNLITVDPWTIELDRNVYRLEQFKRKAPEQYAAHTARILGDLDALRIDVTVWFEANRNSRKRKR